MLQTPEPHNVTPIHLKPKASRITNRRSDFHQDMVAEVRDLAASGWTDSEIAVQMGISIPTLYRWRKLHPDFDDALQMAKKIADDRVEGVMFRTAVGYDYVEQQAIKIKTGPDTEAVEVVEVIRHQPASDAQVRFWLKNRRRGEWTDQTDLNVSGQIDVNVNADPRALAIAMIATLRAGIEAPAPVIEHEEPAK